jgi:hypothetical protein
MRANIPFPFIAISASRRHLFWRQQLSGRIDGWTLPGPLGQEALVGRSG